MLWLSLSLALVLLVLSPTRALLVLLLLLVLVLLVLLLSLLLVGRIPGKLGCERKRAGSPLTVTSIDSGPKGTQPGGPPLNRAEEPV